MDVLACLPILEICDYSDSHKSKEWKKYAAATAAAYAKALPEELPVTKTHSEAASVLNFKFAPSSGDKFESTAYAMYDVGQDIPQDHWQAFLDSLRLPQSNCRLSPGDSPQPANSTGTYRLELTNLVGTTITTS